jgi:hypothetical protein
MPSLGATWGPLSVTAHATYLASSDSRADAPLPCLARLPGLSLSHFRPRPPRRLDWRRSMRPLRRRRASAPQGTRYWRAEHSLRRSAEDLLGCPHASVLRRPPKPSVLWLRREGRPRGSSRTRRRRSRSGAARFQSHRGSRDHRSSRASRSSRRRQSCAWCLAAPCPIGSSAAGRRRWPS